MHIKHIRMNAAPLPSKSKFHRSAASQSGSATSAWKDPGAERTITCHNLNNGRKHPAHWVSIQKSLRPFGFHPERSRVPLRSVIKFFYWLPSSPACTYLNSPGFTVHASKDSNACNSSICLHIRPFFDRNTF